MGALDRCAEFIGDLMSRHPGMVGELNKALKGPIVAGYPQPTEDLHELEAEVWRKTVMSMPPHWFTPDSWPLLKQYCISISHLNYLDDMLIEMRHNKRRDDDYLKDIEKLSKMIRAENRALAFLAKTLRVGPASRMRSSKQTEKDFQMGSLRVDPDQPKPWANGTDY